MVGDILGIYCIKISSVGFKTCGIHKQALNKHIPYAWEEGRMKIQTGYIHLNTRILMWFLSQSMDV